MAEQERDARFFSNTFDEDGKPLGITEVEEVTTKDGEAIDPRFFQDLIVGNNVLKAPPTTTMAERALGVVDAGLSMASAGANTIIGGLAGTVATPLFGAETGANVVNSFTNTIREPQTTEGQQNLESVGGYMQSIIDELNIPLASIGGFIELLTNQGVEQAIETYSRIPKEGAGVVAGDRVLEETGNPLLATGARILPEALVEIAGAKGGAGAIRQGGASIAPTVAEDAIKSGVSRVVRGSREKQNIARLIEEDSVSTDTAGFKLEDPSRVRRMLGATEQVAVKSPRQLAARNQGYKDGVITVVARSSAADKAKYREMLNTLERAMKDEEFSIDNRPSDASGNSLLKRYKAVRAANKGAGKRLEIAAKGLEGKAIKSSDIFSGFESKLSEKLGVVVNEDGTPNFDLSIIEGLGGPEIAVTNILKRLNRNRTPTAKELHDMKLFIDEQVTFGKTETGLGGRTERVLKDLRRDINVRLGENFDPYKKANADYSETITALDDLQDAAGKKMNFDGANADQALGTLLRKIMSNAQSRINLTNAAMEMERVAAKFGTTFDDNIKRQIIFANELDSVFPTQARTSFQGEIAKAAQSMPTSSADMALKVAEKIEGKIKGRSPERAIKAMRDLINSND
jgi:hypothetical protein